MSMEVERNSVDLAFLVSRWSSNSHTFVTALGEFCPSLEDVAMLIGLPTFGNFHLVDSLDVEGEKLVEELHAPMTKYSLNKGTYLSWLKYFKDGVGITSHCHLAAFFTYCLSYFVFPSP